MISIFQNIWKTCRDTVRTAISWRGKKSKSGSVTKMTFVNLRTMKTIEVKVGDRIRIIRLDDPYALNSYNGREGVVRDIDSLGQLHGTWGGLAVIPEEDEFEIL